MKKNKYWLMLFIVSTSIIFQSCKPKTSDNPEELITTLRLSFSEGSNSTAFSFKDIDGIGSGLDGVTDTIILDTAKTYQLTVEVLDESSSPTIITSDEIRKEGVDHQFFFNPSVGLFITQTYTDVDANGNPIGLSDIIITGSQSNGTLRVNLKHQPGIKDGQQTTGESDVDVSFPVIIK